MQDTPETRYYLALRLVQHIDEHLSRVITTVPVPVNSLPLLTRRW